MKLYPLEETPVTNGSVVVLQPASTGAGKDEPVVPLTALQPASIEPTIIGGPANAGDQVDGTDGNWLMDAGASFTASAGAHSYFVQPMDAAEVLDSNWLMDTGASFTASAGAHSYFVQQTDATEVLDGVGDDSYDPVPAQPAEDLIVGEVEHDDLDEESVSIVNLEPASISWAGDGVASSAQDLETDNGASHNYGTSNEATITVVGLDAGVIWAYQYGASDLIPGDAGDEAIPAVDAIDLFAAEVLVGVGDDSYDSVPAQPAEDLIVGEVEHDDLDEESVSIVNLEPASISWTDLESAIIDAGPVV